MDLFLYSWVDISTTRSNFDLDFLQFLCIKFHPNFYQCSTGESRKVLLATTALRQQYICQQAPIAPPVENNKSQTKIGKSIENWSPHNEPESDDVAAVWGSDFLRMDRWTVEWTDRRTEVRILVEIEIQNACRLAWLACFDQLTESLTKSQSLNTALPARLMRVTVRSWRPTQRNSMLFAKRQQAPRTPKEKWQTPRYQPKVW